MIIKILYLYIFFLKYVFYKVVLFLFLCCRRLIKCGTYIHILYTCVRYRANSSFGIYAESNSFVWDTWDTLQNLIPLCGIRCRNWFLSAVYAAETDSSVWDTLQKLIPLRGIHRRNWFLCVGYTAEAKTSAGIRRRNLLSVQIITQKPTPLDGINCFLCVGYTAETDSSMWDTLQKLRSP
jgi:hypothetical protein